MGNKRRHWKLSEESKKNISFGHVGINTWMKGRKNAWKDNVGYRAIHSWIAKEKGKPHYCKHCKRSDLFHRQYHWANKSGLYKRDLSDWLRLCASCHKKYDKKFMIKKEKLLLKSFRITSKQVRSIKKKANKFGGESAYIRNLIEQDMYQSAGYKK